MKANLLVVTGNEFKNTITSDLENLGFSLYFARGRLKVKEIFKERQVDVIVWLLSEDEKRLAGDLLTIFNENEDVPIVIITEKLANYNFSEKIRASYTNIDINDDPKEIRKAIETACTQSLGKEAIRKEKDLPEIEFKNTVSSMVSDQKSYESDVHGSEDKLHLSSPWIAVGKKEKDILSDQMIEKKTSKIKSFIQNLIKKP